MGYTFGVGREAPAFAISAVDGNEINLRQYRGDWFPVLVFLPSQADAAGQALQRLGTAAGALWGLRGQLLAVCVASRADAAELAGPAPTFPLLPDDGSVARAYGALREDGTVRPLAFIIDRAGKIVWSGEGAAALDPAALRAAFRQVVR